MANILRQLGLEDVVKKLIKENEELKQRVELLEKQIGQMSSPSK